MKIIVHFGFPKTGSSTLQYGLFKPKHDENKLVLSTWRQEDPKENHDRRPSSCLFRRLPILDEYLDFNPNKLNILSDESFTAPVKLRENNYGSDILDPIFFPGIIKEQITSKYGVDVEIEAFITIRNQADQIYSQYVEEYNLKKYKGVDLVFDNSGEVDLAGFEIYQYNKYILELERVFSPEKVHVTFFEDWKMKPSFFYGKISKVFGIEENHVKELLEINHVNRKEKNSEGYYTKDGEDFIKRFTESQNEKIKAYFRSDNLKLQRRFDSKYDLLDLGYLSEI